MRAIILPEVEAGRIRTGPYGSDASYGHNGAFRFHALAVIASDGTDSIAQQWEHVSVSLADRCPTWEEMCFVKNLFWGPEETVLQFHPSQSKYINCHPYTLHLWRKIGKPVELPPSMLIT